MDQGPGLAATHAADQAANQAADQAATQAAPPPAAAEPGDLALAATVLTPLRALFDAAVAVVAGQCAVDGRLDAGRLDAQQWVCHALALASADLLAAETVICQAQAGSAGPRDAGLALAFAVEAALAVLARLDAVALETGSGLAPLRALASSGALDSLRCGAGSAARLAALGQAVADDDSEIGPVTLDDDTRMARDAFRRFAAEVVAPQAEAIHRQDLTVPETLLQALREMGVFGLAIPEAYGGHMPEGADAALTMIAVTEALSEASLAAAGSLITRPEILARALLAGGTDAQKQHWLPRLAAGDPLCAIAITEPDHGSDVAGLTFKGRPVPGGWRLDGAKTWCTFAGKAGVLMVVTRTDPDRRLGHRGLSLLLVEKPSLDGHAFDISPPGGGRLRGRAIPTLGYRGMHSFDLAFEDVFVPDSHVIGGPAGLGQGFYYTMAGMVGGRMQTAGRAAGVMRAALSAAVRHARDRRVFDAPLISYPLTQVKIAQMAARLAACRQLAYAVGRRLHTPAGRVEASLVKLLACRSAEWLTREALQIHGGIGYAEETAVSRYFVDARVLSIFEGAEETLALKVVARGLLEAALAQPRA